MKKTCLILLFFFIILEVAGFYSLTCFSETGDTGVAGKGYDSPFLSWGEEQGFKKEKARGKIDYLKVTAILHSQGQAAVVINGKVVRKGDVIDNKEVIQIDTEEVILQDTLGNEYVVSLDKIASSRESVPCSGESCGKGFFDTNEGDF
ncbi:MAG: hypothetical protein PHU64_04185 [Candidatus Omnitrophica bacterium]|nr:hypothetical protein [Candidatus Omnitrophota bacterium]MDD5429255.1 hypothetical protein [Candidatus Omnitrophota bacterium]